ncbi:MULTISPECIES: c-type cytochrome domain-containing protein [Emticicia]|uniref:c-type cytochrome domain-containing protein n=1 Tax=Emticicia TaxID=312278 RepID=UPI0007D8B8C6|nr:MULTISPECIES: c-type cytochrome domain-containing protein [Emticicia]
MFQTELIGHLHPLIVHLPIGILIFAYVMMVVQQFRKIDMNAAINLALLLGTISSVMACIAGWFLAQSGDYETEAIFKHQWTGISTAILGILAYFLKNYRWILATATIICLMISGHFGGNLTHGEGYFFSTKTAISAPIDSTKMASFDSIDSTKTSSQNTVRKSFVYRDKIVPILKTKCYNCHSASKKKGGLRLDTEVFIKKGGKNGQILLAGNPSKSTLFTHLILPEDDEKHMPPKGKTQLTKSEISAIHFWIKKGASFVEEIETISNQRPLEQTFIQNTQISSEAIADIPIIEKEDSRLVANNVEAISPTVLEKLKQQNIGITYLNNGSNYISANFVNVRNYQPSLLNDLESTSNQLVNLRLSNQPVNDEAIKKITNFKNLKKLNLENTAITDASLEHLKTLPNLEQLNLYGTNITDRGLEALTKYPNLKVVYLWQTKASKSGIEQLKKALPKLQIETGEFQFSKPDTNRTIK